MKLFEQTILVTAVLGFFLNGCENKGKPMEKIMDEGVVLSAIKGEQSKAGKISFTNTGGQLNNIYIETKGEHADMFQVESSKIKKINSNETVTILVTFHPKEDFIGIANAALILSADTNKKFSFPLKALSTKALEGKNEPPLADVVSTLGYRIDVGWTSLGNHIKPDLMGDELEPSNFVKANEGNVQMIPVARYSPPFELPFGYYMVEGSMPEHHEVGILSNSNSYPEHQTLYPSTIKGENSFDPGKNTFGFYTTSPSHVAYSEDELNSLLFDEHAAHACRIYPIRDAAGVMVENQYLVCFEEAANGDYQDYVFLVKNVKPSNK